MVSFGCERTTTAARRGRLPERWTLPAVDDTNRAWFTSGTLAVQRCTSCSTLQHPPEEIPALLAELVRGNDVVYGAPAEEQHGILRDLASRIIHRAS